MGVAMKKLLAMVSLPDYTPNLSLKLTPEQQFNKASLGTYEFGSVFKLFNTAMALAYKDITPTSVFDATEPIKIGRKTIEDYRGEERPLTITEILMPSSKTQTGRSSSTETPSTRSTSCAAEPRTRTTMPFLRGWRPWRRVSGREAEHLRGGPPKPCRTQPKENPGAGCLTEATRPTSAGCFSLRWRRTRGVSAGPTTRHGRAPSGTR